MDGMISGTELPEAARGLVRKAGVAFNPFLLVFGADEKKHREASPLCQVREGLPAFLLLHAEMELPLLSEMAADFGEALKKAKNDVEVRKIDKRNHYSIFFNADDEKDPVNQAVVGFVKRLAP
jgi:hypothetical protein